MTTNTAQEIPSEPPATPRSSSGVPLGIVLGLALGRHVDRGSYSDAAETYLAGATWLEPGDAVFTVHLRSIAASLDRQIRTTGVLQSALASSYDKVIFRLEHRRPAPNPAAPDPSAPSPDGTDSIFNHLD